MGEHHADLQRNCRDVAAEVGHRRCRPEAHKTRMGEDIPSLVVSHSAASRSDRRQGDGTES